VTPDDAPPLPPGRPLELAGRGVTFVRDCGPGSGDPARPPLLLLHGWTVTADLNFFHAYPVLTAAGHRVVALDHRGHGRGIRPPDGRVRLSDCADDAAAVLDRLGIERALVVGYSMGGLVAQLLWKRHPERVAGLVFGSTAARIPVGPVGLLWQGGRDPVAGWARRAGRRTDAWVRSRVVRRVADGDRHERWMRSEYLRGDGVGIISALGSLSRFSSEGWIDALDRPAATVVTLADTVVPPGRQRDLARRCGAPIVTVDAPHDAIVSHHRRYLPRLLRAVDDVTRRI